MQKIETRLELLYQMKENSKYELTKKTIDIMIKREQNKVLSFYGFAPMK